MSCCERAMRLGERARERARRAVIFVCELHARGQIFLPGQRSWWFRYNVGKAQLVTKSLRFVSSPLSK